MHDDIFDTDEMELSDFFAMILGGLIISFPCYLISFQIATELGFGEWLSAWANDLHIIWKFIYYIVHISIGFLVLVSVLTIIYTVGKFLLIGLLNAGEWLSDNISVLIENIVRILAEITLFLVNGAIYIALYPFRIIVGIALSFISNIRRKYEESQEIRRIFKEQYTADFKDFQEFKRYWDAVQRGEEPPYPGTEEEPKPKAKKKYPDPYAEALELFGLGQVFTEAEFKSRYLQLMKKHHPDITGDNKAAQKINAARTTIKNRKDWK